MLNAQVVFDKFIVFVKFRLGSSQKAAYLFAAKGNTVFRKGSFLWRLLEKHKTEVLFPCDKPRLSSEKQRAAAVFSV